MVSVWTRQVESGASQPWSRSLAREEERTELTLDSGVGVSSGETAGDAGGGTEDEGEGKHERTEQNTKEEETNVLELEVTMDPERM